MNHSDDGAMQASDGDGLQEIGRRRSQSRLRLAPAERSADTFLRLGDNITVVERRPPTQAADYDWYDREGMRVRVREI